MTNITFNAAVRVDNLKLSINEESRDGRYYEIKLIEFSDSLFVTRKHNEEISQNTIYKANSLTYPLHLVINVSKIKDSDKKQLAKTRTYYLIVSRNNNSYKVKTYGKKPVYSGAVKARTWNEIIRKSQISFTKDKDDLLKFFLLHTPAISKNNPGIRYTDLHILWREDCFSRKTGSLRRKLNEHVVQGLQDRTGGISSSEKDIKERLNKLSLTELNLSEINPLGFSSRIVMVDTQNNKYLSLFRHIRNSIAHGTFTFQHDRKTNTEYFVFQDSRNKNVNARGIIDLKILLAWKEICLNPRK